MIQIRPATIDDAPAIYRLHTSAIRRICSARYSPEEVADWSGALTVERYLDAMDQTDFQIAELDGVPAGFSVLDIGHAELHALYVGPEYVRRGVGRALLARAEQNAAARHLAALHLKATLNAVTFYQRNGWTVLAPAPHALPSGRTLSCTLMRKELSREESDRRHHELAMESSP